MNDCDVVFNIFLAKGMSMPIAHVEESWQMAEFYSNKVDDALSMLSGKHIAFSDCICLNCSFNHVRSYVFFFRFWWSTVTKTLIMWSGLRP